MRKTLLVISLLLTLAANQSLQATESASRVPGTRVFISPPEGFVASDQFLGFIKPDQSASIAVTEAKGPFDQVVASFSQNELAARGMNLTASSVLTVGRGQGSKGSIIEFTQTTAGKKFKKVACIFGDSTNTTIVTGSMPDGSGSELFDSLKAAVKSARFDARARIAGPDEGLPFTIGDTKKFKKASRLHNVLLFSTSGKMETGKDNGPIFAASQSSGEVPVEEREAFAKERLLHTPQVKNITIDKVNTVKQAGLEGHEFLAKGTDVEDGVPTFVFQTILFGKDKYYIFQGLCPLAQRAQNEPEYQQLVSNFSVR